MLKYRDTPNNSRVLLQKNIETLYDGLTVSHKFLITLLNTGVFMEKKYLCYFHGFSKNLSNILTIQGKRK